MAGTRPPRERETAPGAESGAVSFPCYPEGGRKTQGIVRLSDIIGAGGAGAAGAEGAGARCAPDKPKPASNARFVAEKPGPGPDIGASDGQLRQFDRSQTRRSRRCSGEGAWKHSSDSRKQFATRRPSTDPSVQVPPSDRAGDPDDSAPAHESLFSADADGSRQPRRERKPLTALQRALGLLTRREHSRKELIRKLVSRGVGAAEVEAAVDKLTSAGWQDDRRFAESLVRSRVATGYGPLHIRAELGTHGLPAGIRKSVLDDFDGDWVKIARDLVARRFERFEDPCQRERKASDYLIRRGFPGDVVRAAVRFQPDD